MEYVNERKGRCVRPVLGSSLWIISFLAAGFLENQTFSNEVFTNAIARVPQRNPRYASFPARPLPRASPHDPLCDSPARPLPRFSARPAVCALAHSASRARKQRQRKKSPHFWQLRTEVRSSQSSRVRLPPRSHLFTQHFGRIRCVSRLAGRTARAQPAYNRKVVPKNRVFLSLGADRRTEGLADTRRRRCRCRRGCSPHGGSCSPRDGPDRDAGATGAAPPRDGAARRMGRRDRSPPARRRAT